MPIIVWITWGDAAYLSWWKQHIQIEDGLILVGDWKMGRYDWDPLWLWESVLFGLEWIKWEYIAALAKLTFDGGDCGCCWRPKPFPVSYKNVGEIGDDPRRLVSPLRLTWHEWVVWFWKCWVELRA